MKIQVHCKNMDDELMVNLLHFMINASIIHNFQNSWYG